MLNDQLLQQLHRPFVPHIDLLALRPEITISKSDLPNEGFGELDVTTQNPDGQAEAHYSYLQHPVGSLTAKEAGAGKLDNLNYTIERQLCKSLEQWPRVIDMHPPRKLMSMTYSARQRHKLRARQKLFWTYNSDEFEQKENGKFSLHLFAKDPHSAWMGLCMTPQKQTPIKARGKTAFPFEGGFFSVQTDMPEPNGSKTLQVQIWEADDSGEMQEAFQFSLAGTYSYIGAPCQYVSGRLTLHWS